MDFLTGLHGGLATILLCALLFVDEAGVPLPFAPNEVLLIMAGLLIASGSLAWFIILPLASAAIILGSFSGYSWAKAVGPVGLRSVAVRFHAEKSYDRARHRVLNADAWHIAISRCIPGARNYVTLVSGAAGVPLSAFMRATVPASIAWTSTFIALGVVVGAPAAKFFSSVEKLALSGALFVVLGLLAYRAARSAPRILQPADQQFAGMASPHRVAVAIILDIALVTVIAAGIDRILRSFVQIRIANFPELVPRGLEFLLLFIAVGIFYVISLRHGQTGETPGERIFEVTYVHKRHRASSITTNDADDENLPA